MTLQAPAARVLVIEDEPDLCEATVTFLKLEGFQAEGLGSIAAAEAWSRIHSFDLLVLDLGLPDGDGLTWLAAHPEWQGKGVVITTARGEESQRVRGIKSGADVYLVKPVSLEELASLLRNLWRRIKGSAQPVWQLQPMAWALSSPLGQALKLTHSELVVLQRLAATPGQVVTRQALVEALGHNPDTYDYRRMEVLIRRLRNKVRDSMGLDLPLETAHRLGYAFTARLQLV